MSIFNRKQKVILEEFCQEYYDKYILNLKIADVDVRIGTAEVFKKSIVEIDSSFVNIDIQIFLNEITLLRFEIFSLALLHQLGDKKTAAQSQFTKKYLKENNREDIWEDLEQYNQAISLSSRLNQTLDTLKGRTHILFVDRMRMDLYDLWTKQGFEGKCVARAANRIMTDVAWKKNITQAYLMVALCKRLGYEYNNESKLCNRLGDELKEEAQIRLLVIINGFYNGSIDSLKMINIE
jgi:hypothetical protein